MKILFILLLAVSSAFAAPNLDSALTRQLDFAFLEPIPEGFDSAELTAALTPLDGVNSCSLLLWRVYTKPSLSYEYGYGALLSPFEGETVEPAGAFFVGGGIAANEFRATAIVSGAVDEVYTILRAGYSDYDLRLRFRMPTTSEFIFQNASVHMSEQQLSALKLRAFAHYSNALRKFSAGMDTLSYVFQNASVLNLPWSLTIDESFLVGIGPEIVFSTASLPIKLAVSAYADTYPTLGGKAELRWEQHAMDRHGVNIKLAVSYNSFLQEDELLSERDVIVFSLVAYTISTRERSVE